MEGWALKVTTPACLELSNQRSIALLPTTHSMPQMYTIHTQQTQQRPPKENLQNLIPHTRPHQGKSYQEEKSQNLPGN